MAKSRKYIATAIYECLKAYGDWIKIRDLQPLVCDHLGENISRAKIRGHMIQYDLACRRFSDDDVFEYKL